MKLAFLGFDKQPVLQEPLQNHTDVLCVFLWCAGVDEDVIQIHKDKPVDHVSEHVVHKILENSRCISEAEWHDQILKVPQWCVKGRLPFVTFMDPDQVVSIAPSLVW